MEEFIKLWFFTKYDEPRGLMFMPTDTWSMGKSYIDWYVKNRTLEA